MIHETRRGRRRRGRALRADGGSRPALLDVGTPGRAPACPGAKPPQSAGLNLTCPPRRLVDRRSRARAAEDAGWRRREVPSRAIARRRRRPARLVRAPRAAISPRAWRRCAFASRRGRWISRGRTGASPTETTRARAPGMREMYGEYRELKAAMDKENARAAVRGKPTSPAATPPSRRSPRHARRQPAPLADASGLRANVPPHALGFRPRTTTTLPPARPESSDDDDDDVVDATPVKLPTRVQPDRAADPPREPYPRGTRAATSTTRWPPRPRNRNHARHPRSRTQSRPRRPPNRRN